MSTASKTGQLADAIYGKKLNFKSIVNTVLTGFHLKRPVMIWGGPGIGKSSLVQLVVNHLNKNLKAGEEPFQLIVLSLSQYEFSDLRGIPYVRNGDMIYSMVDHLPYGLKTRGILFVDELPNAKKEVMTAAYQLINDRCIGSYKLPEGWYCVAAGNRLSDRGATVAVPKPLGNRFTHVEMDTTPKSLFTDWEDWALGAGKQHPSCIGFLKTDNDSIYSFSTDYQAWASPRSWSFVSDMLTHNVDIIPFADYDSNSHLSDAEIKAEQNKIRDAFIIGSVGEVIGRKFIAYLSVYQDLPTKQQMLSLNPTYDFAADNQICYGIGTILSSHFRQREGRHVSNEEFNGGLVFIEKLIQKNKVDLAATFLRDFAINGKFNNSSVSSTISANVKAKFKTIKESLTKHM
jgi:hypothetical protein